MQGHQIIMLGSNNYLSLTSDKRVIEAGEKALGEFGSGVSGSRFLNGTTISHIKLEQELANFLNKEACLIFTTGYLANVGFLSAIAGRDELIFCDRENHASIYDGIKLGNGKMIRYYHNDMNDLEAKLIEAGDTGKLIVTDGVFSMSGDICDLPTIVKLAKKYHARIMVDDAHGLGVLGENGRGTGEYYGLEDKIDIVMGTFSKSLASIGGYIAGSSAVIEYIKHTSRPFIFCAALPPANIECARKSLEIIQTEKWRFKKLLEISMYTKQKLIALGYKILNKDVTTPIIGLVTHGKLRTLLACKLLFKNGVFVNPILPPAAPNNECIIRISLQTDCSVEIINQAIEIIDATLKQIPESEVEVQKLIEQQR